MDERAIRHRLCELAEILSAVPKPDSSQRPAGTYVSNMPSSASRNLEDLCSHVRLQANLPQRQRHSSQGPKSVAIRPAMAQEQRPPTPRQPLGNVVVVAVCDHDVPDCIAPARR